MKQCIAAEKTQQSNMDSIPSLSDASEYIIHRWDSTAVMWYYRTFPLVCYIYLYRLHLGCTVLPWLAQNLRAEKCYNAALRCLWAISTGANDDLWIVFSNGRMAADFNVSMQPFLMDDGLFGSEWISVSGRQWGLAVWIYKISNY